MRTIIVTFRSLLSVCIAGISISTKSHSTSEINQTTGMGVISLKKSSKGFALILLIDDSNNWNNKWNNRQ